MILHITQLPYENYPAFISIDRVKSGIMVTVRSKESPIPQNIILDYCEWKEFVEKVAASGIPQC